MPPEAAVPIVPPVLPPTEEAVLRALAPVVDPEVGLSVVDLGLVYEVAIEPDGAVRVTFTATTPGCPMVAAIGNGIFYALKRLPGATSVEARLVWEPPWTPERITPEGRARLAGGTPA